MEDVVKINNKVLQKFLKKRFKTFGKKETSDSIMYVVDFFSEIEGGVLGHTMGLFDLSKDTGGVSVDLVLAENIPLENIVDILFAINEFNNIFDMEKFVYDSYSNNCYVKLSLCNECEILLAEKLALYTQRLIGVYNETKMIMEGVIAGDVSPAKIIEYILNK